MAVSLWADVRVDPVEIALPGGVGFTLRAYRPAGELAAPEIDRSSGQESDDFEAASAAVAATRRRSDRAEDEDEDEIGEIQWPEDIAPEDEPAAEEAEAADDKTEDDEETEGAAGPEEVPVFLGHRGKLYLFHSADKLVEFVKSGAAHDLTQLDTWSQLTGRLKPGDIEPEDSDRYELDLVVENLRGGPDAWDPTLIIKAGEVARDVAYALRMQPVLTALATGSPLDDLDDALRTAEEGGIKAIFARRRLRKAGGQQAVLGWRTIVGKISAAVDWRD